MDDKLDGASMIQHIMDDWPRVGGLADEVFSHETGIGTTAEPVVVEVERPSGLNTRSKSHREPKPSTGSGYVTRVDRNIAKRISDILSPARSRDDLPKGYVSQLDEMGGWIQIVADGIKKPSRWFRFKSWFAKKFFSRTSP